MGAAGRGQAPRRETLNRYALESFLRLIFIDFPGNFI
jgi:hypothetical protein